MYIYPDSGDRLTIELINKVSRGEYWKKSEERVLSKACDQIKKLERRRLLDAGCGLGRLFSVFSPLAQEMWAVEPDRDRYESAVKAAESINNVKINVINGDMTSLPENLRFDAVISSHVFQHVPEKTACEMADMMASRIENGGLAIVLTTHTSGDEDIFTKEYFKNSERTAKTVDRREFQAAFDEKGVLPVRMFSEKTVLEQAARRGFKPLLVTGYHYAMEADEPDDEMLNSVGDRKKARDILYVFRKKERGDGCGR